MIEVRLRLKFEFPEGEQYLELSEGEARKLHEVLGGIFKEPRGCTIVPMPYPVNAPGSPLPWQPIWTGTPVYDGNSIASCTSLEVLL